MNPSKSKVSKRDLTLLKGKLSGILTSSRESVEDLAEAAPVECKTVGQVLRNFAKSIRGGREWLAACMASLPPESWVDNGTYMSVQDANGASLKYCIPGEEVADAAANAAQFRTREALCRSLADSVDDETSERFGAMVRWSVLRFANRERHPVLLDVAIADSISVLEGCFYGTYAKREREWRERFCDEPCVPTPPEVIRDLADSVQSELIEPLLQTAQAASGADNLSVRLLSNIAANRLLLESAQQAAHARQAQEFAVELLSALNSQGIYEVPEVDNDEDIRQKLKEWFAPKEGGLSNLPRFDRKHDAATDAGLLYTLRLAEQVQSQYISLRGSAGGQDMARRQFGGPCNKLLFALIVTACAYAGVEVSEELHGDGSRKLPAYPARGKRTGQPSTHAMDLFFAVFGHIAFSNVGWALSTEAVTAYSDALAHKRARWQELAFLLFKRQGAPGLLAVHNVLTGRLDRMLAASAVGERGATPCNAPDA